MARGERLAVNTPIQGAAADIMKRAMIAAEEKLSGAVPDAQIVLQVHDELLVEVESGQAELARKEVHDAMVGAASLDVPLVVDSQIGASWADIH